MREALELGTFDTAPYKEWLGVVGSLIVAALVFAGCDSTAGVMP
jgi:hypothetical protein